MTKAKRSNETLSKAVRKCQASVTIQASTGLRKHALSPLEEQLKQQAFLNDSNRWSRTSNLSINEKSDTAFYVRLLQRQTTHSKKGKRVSSAKFDTRLAAENHAYSFRYSKESRNCQIRLDAYVASQKLMFTVCDEEDAAASSPPLHTLNEPTNEISTELTNLKPFGFIWNAFFRPSPMVQKMLDEAYENLGFMPGQYDAVYCRVGHPAFKNKKKDHDPEADRGKGYVFEGENKILAISTAVHGIQCSKWLAEHHYGMQQQSSQTNNTAAAAFPVYFYADSSDLVRTIVTPNSHNTTTPEEQALLAILSNTTTESFKVVGRPDVPIAHISPLKKKRRRKPKSNIFVLAASCLC